ncbi:hypothetical protein pEaSNUABM29_00163 [Erwinia phage pEa_SNUABM_29]|nr:hypothetical protein pEaSNUABM29_00163 [Erwinia phage pEa_SNUABM_29]
MTTIAFDGVSLASDSQMTQAQYRLDLRTEKIFKCPEGETWFVDGKQAIAFGVAGGIESQQILRNVLAGHGDTMGLAAHTRWPEGISMSYLVITVDGEVYTGGQEVEKAVPWIAKVEPPMAVGSGCEFAIGAMAAGVSATDAVKVAIRYDINSGGEIQELDLGLQPEDPSRRKLFRYLDQ